MSSTAAGSDDLCISIRELRREVISLLLHETIRQDGPPTVRFRCICDELGIPLSLTPRPPDITRRDFRTVVRRTRARPVRDVLRGLRAEGCVSWEQDKSGVVSGHERPPARRYTVHVGRCQELGLL